ncbi:MAG: RtcB family protein [Gemmatimonadetes bacterium]|nr:RtcB family protein [Gemmatimonadota bacterium]
MIFGTHDDKTIAQFEDVRSRAVSAALMADGHLGYVMPVGGVASYRGQVSVVGVGFDIACGNAAIRTDLEREDLPEDLNDIADRIFAELSFGVGLTNTSGDAPDEHDVFDDERWDLLPGAVRDGLERKARAQLGTIGGGNHYVDVFEDESSAIWVGVHFGSRGFGHTVASGFLALAQGASWGTRVPERETLLDLASPLGHDYWHLMNLAGRYAYAGREWVVRKVVAILGASERELVHNHHNFAWEEEHDGETLIVVRKGATPAWPGQEGFVGGSMGDEAVILRGAAIPTESEEASGRRRASLFSTVHGAGRVMSRTAAKGRWRKGVQVRPGRISHEDMHAWIERRGVVLRGADLDEAPQAYRRLPDVLEAQGDTIEILHRLRPLIVCMAPGDTVDPYRD